jgi:hypothetical protein
MANNKKPTKAVKLKIIKALEMLAGFSAATAVEDTSDSDVRHVLNITGTYQIKKDGSNLSFSLVFLTPGVGAITTAKLNDPVASINIPIDDIPNDSIQNKLISSDTVAEKKFFELRSTIGASNFTNVPANFEATLTIEGGVQSVSFPVPEASFKEVGDRIVLEVSIFIF